MRQGSAIAPRLRSRGETPCRKLHLIAEVEQPRPWLKTLGCTSKTMDMGAMAWERNTSSLHRD